MKHPLKRFAREPIVDDARRTEIEANAEGYHLLSEGVRIPADTQAWGPIPQEDGRTKFVPLFQVKDKDGRTLTVPEISIVILHYNTAYLHFRHLEKVKPILADKLAGDFISEATLKELYDYYGHCLSCATTLFAAMEALVSTYVQSTTRYEHNEDRYVCTTTDNEPMTVGYPSILIGTDILRLRMIDKLKYVLPALSGKNFIQQHGVAWQSIMQLKKLRDLITHPKPQSDQLIYNEVFSKMFVFDFDRAMESVKLYINFFARADVHQIVDCGCEHPW